MMFMQWLHWVIMWFYFISLERGHFLILSILIWRVIYNISPSVWGICAPWILSDDGTICQPLLCALTTHVHVVSLFTNSKSLADTICVFPKGFLNNISALNYVEYNLQLNHQLYMPNHIYITICWHIIYIMRKNNRILTI